MENDRRNAPLFWSVIVGVVLTDVVTKAIAVYALVPQRIPREVIGEYLRFTLVYNPGAAFGLHLGGYSRWIFTILTIGALYILSRLYRTTRADDWPRTLALALVCSGAIGNLIDRLRSPLGVVDFIDVGLGPDLRWWTFNVADMAVSAGAFMLAWVLWGEEKAEAVATTQLSSKANEI
ncbi:MAG: signal peptidase II [Gemmatimonadaceae bacterium]